MYCKLGNCIVKIILYIFIQCIFCTNYMNFNVTFIPDLKTKKILATVDSTTFGKLTMLLYLRGKYFV